MRTSHKVLLVPLFVLVFVGIGAGSYYLAFYRHKKGLNDELQEHRESMDGFKRAIDEKSTTEQRLRDLAAATLGFNAEVVDSNFRSALSRLATDAGLVPNDIVVTTQAARAVKNPAVEAKVLEFRKYAKAEFVEASDLYMTDAEVRGSGTFAAVTRLLALAQSQPWIWSVRGFSLKPQDSTASSFDIRLDLSTAFMPDLAPPKPADSGASPTQEPPIIDPPASQVVATSEIVRRNVFAPFLPPDPEAALVRRAPPTEGVQGEGVPLPPPPPPPYHEWRLAGVSGSPSQGTLAWMLNVRTGSAVLLSPGQGVLDATLILAAGDSAVFQIGEHRYRLALNESLADRHQVE